ncbi:MAG: hypothetical protein Q8P30_00085 [Candidatus Uhrbacteria bacterium]|nr:hypothetical protein [Candidatus Uhrbacteria bacterium]
MAQTTPVHTATTIIPAMAVETTMSGAVNTSFAILRFETFEMRFRTLFEMPDTYHLLTIG